MTGDEKQLVGEIKRRMGKPHYMTLEQAAENSRFTMDYIQSLLRDDKIIPLQPARVRKDG
jgi:hypothetical protein